MKLTQHVLYALEDADAGKLDSALMNACVAIDPTAKLLYPKVKLVSERYVRCLREYYWLLEPMVGAGLNLVDTRFENVPIPGNPAPDFADIIYKIFRCTNAHGDEIPRAYHVTKSHGGFRSLWALTKDELHMPDRVVFALLAIAVFSRANAGLKTVGEHWLALGDERFKVKDWWGREDDFRPVAARYNQTRVTLAALHRVGAIADAVNVEHVTIKQPYMP